MAAGADDGSIPNEATLLRRVHPDQVVEDKNAGGLRASSAVFKDPEMSVDVEQMLEAVGLDWRFSLLGHPDHSLVRIAAGLARAAGQAVVHDPIPGNEAHALVKGKKSPGIANRLRDAAEAIVMQKKQV